MFGYFWLNFLINSLNAGPSFFGSEVSHQVKVAFSDLASGFSSAPPPPQPATASARAASPITPLLRTFLVRLRANCICAPRYPHRPGSRRCRGKLVEALGGLGCLVVGVLRATEQATGGEPLWPASRRECSRLLSAP